MYTSLHTVCLWSCVYFINRIPLYEGSPRVLFALTDPFNGTLHFINTVYHDTMRIIPVASSQSFSTIPGCILSIIVEPHPPLQKVAHLFPEYIVMTIDDVIPGVTDINTQDGMLISSSCNWYMICAVDILSRPKLTKTTTASLDKVCVNFVCVYMLELYYCSNYHML